MKRYIDWWSWISGLLQLFGLTGDRVTVSNLARTGTRPADWVLVNARILTSNAEQPRVDAIAIKGERIAYVGDHKGVADFIGPETEVVDGRGRLATPGFVENHCHVLWIGGMTYLQPPDLFGCNTQEEILAWVKKRAEEHPDLPLIGAIGWRMSQLPKGPRREILDAVVSDRPVMLMAYSGQGGWLNSTAIKWMESRNPEAFERLEPVRDPGNGQATGECKHYHVINYLDYWTWQELGPEVEAGIMGAMEKTLEEALSYGVTTMHDIQIYPQFIPTILKFRDRGGLDKARLRCAYYVGRERLEDEAALERDLREWQRLRQTESGPHLVLGESVKLYIDGTADNKTAFMREPYSDDPTTYGRPDWTASEFKRVVTIVDRLGLQACTHTCGDAGAIRVLDAYEHALHENGMRDARHSIEHCEMAPPEEWPRIARLGIHASMQPQHFYGDEMMESRLGHERLQWRMAWRSMAEAGVPISFGTDWAAGPLNPAYGLLIAGTRMNYKGKTDWGPRETVPIETGIRYWTIGSARNLFMEDEVGSLEPGKYADLVLFNTDLRKMSTLWFLLTHDIGLGTLDHFVDMTIVGGQIVYEKDRPGRTQGRLALLPRKRAKSRKTISERVGIF